MGCFIGKRISKRQLNHGDVVKIGRHEFKFVDDTAGEFDKTVMIPAASTPVKQQGITPKKGFVKIMSGPKAGEQIILNKPYTTLGSPGVQVAVIARRGKSYYLMPMGGVGDRSNPPRLNDQPLGTESIPLKEGDVIEVAGSKLKFTSNG